MAPVEHLTFYLKETTMGFKEGFYVALAGLLEERGITGATVVDFDEVTRYDGYCETCYYEYSEVVITYEVDGVTETYDYSGSFVDLISALT